MRLRRASYGSAPPLNCGVRRMGFFKSSSTRLLPCSGKYSALPPRALHDRRDALNRLLKYKHQVEFRVAVYFYGDQAILATTTTGAYETGQPVKLPTDVTDEKLGVAIYDLMLECYSHEPRVRRQGDIVTLSDWVVYVASGAKTGRRFEEQSTYVSVRTVNSAIIVEASRFKPPSRTYVGQELNFAEEPAVLGASVRSVVRTLRFLDAHDALK
jgi:hypothetical protein